MLFLTSAWTWAWPWWGTVVAINVVNLLIAIYVFYRSKTSKTDDYTPYKKKLRIAGIIFISVAMYRSIFISRYLTQLAWFNTILNSTLLIRTFALFAEMSFAYLIMSVLLRLNKDFSTNDSMKDTKLMVFLKTKSPIYFFWFIGIANVFAFGGSITKIRLLFAIEETFWGIGFLLITPFVLIQLRTLVKLEDTKLKEALKMYKTFLIIMAVFCVGYVSYSLLYHLPIEYWPAAIEQLQMANPIPEFRFGFSAIKDALLVVNQTHDYDAWGGLGFVIWHSGYFTLCGWMVLYFMNAPRKLLNK